MGWFALSKFANRSVSLKNRFTFGLTRFQVISFKVQLRQKVVSPTGWFAPKSLYSFASSDEIRSLITPNNQKRFNLFLSP